MNKKTISVLALIFIATFVLSASVSAFQMSFNKKNVGAFSSQLKKNLPNYESSFWSWTNSKSFTPPGQINNPGKGNGKTVGKYGKITIKGPLGFGSKKAEYELIENTETCLYNCHAIGKATLYQSGPLFTGLSMKSLDSNVKANIKIKKTKNVTKPNYIQENHTTINGTKATRIVQKGTKQVEKEYWANYTGKTLSPGTYKWKIEGKKSEQDSVDWVASAFGKSFDKWAWWNSSYETRYPHNANGSGYTGIGYFGANKTGWYGTINNSGNSGQIYTYNDTNGSLNYAVANDTSEYCWFDTQNNKSNCPKQTGASDNLVSYYALDRNSGNVEDYIGQNDGTNNGATRGVTGKINNAFNYSNGAVNMGDVSAFDFTGAFSIAVWYKSTNNTWGDFVKKSGVNNENFAYRFGRIDGEGIGFMKSTGGGSHTDIVQGTNTTIMTDGVWHHAVVTRNKSDNWVLYIDSSQIDTATDGQSFTNSYDFKLLSTAPELTLDDVRLYNDSLTSTEVQNLYNSTNNQRPYWGAQEKLTPININLLKPNNNKVFLTTNINFSANVTHDNNNLKNVSLYVDGTEKQVNQSGKNAIYNFSQTISTSGNHTWHINATDGDPDNITVSETRNFQIDLTAPNVTLKSPANNTNFTTNDINFTINVSAGSSQISNASLILNGKVNQTNNTASEGIINFRKSLADGDYNWSAQATSSSGLVGTANETRIFEIDRKSPNISVENKTTLNYGFEGKNETFDFNVTDNNLDSCWFNYNGTNESVSCTADNFTISLEKNNFNLTFYANDTFGNTESEFEEWTYKIFENQQLYNGKNLNKSTNTNTPEGAKDSFTINITEISGTFSTAEFIYNGTARNPDSVSSNGNILINKTIIAPDVNSPTDIGFNWNLTTDDNTEISAQNFSQQVSPINIDDCSTYGTKILEYNLKEETNLTDISGKNESISVDINIFSKGTNKQVLNFSKTYNSNTAKVCIDDNLNTTTYDMDAQAEYQADGFQTERNNLQNFKLTNATIPKNVDLLDLKSSKATDFNLIFKDNSFSKVPEALISIKREYVGSGQFRLVESPLTDDNGQAVASLVAKDGIYRIEVRKDGELLALFDRISAVCANEVTGDCQVNLNAFESDFKLPNFLKYKNLKYQFNLSKTQNKITVDFSTIDGSAANLTLNGTVANRFNNGTVCSDTLTSSLGTLTCDYGQQFANSTIEITLLKEGQVVQTQTFRTLPDTSSIFGETRLVFLLILLLMIPFMFIASTVGMVIGMIFGLIISTIMFLTTGSAGLGIGTATVWLIISGGILIWKLNQGGRGV
ncbi:MAG: LamG domain-containing protein [Candidatus Pacearchaeota archaeon]